MDFLFGADMPLAVRFFVAFVIVLALIGGTAYLVRRFGAERLGGSSSRGRQPRLAVIDAAAVDGRRRLILIRRDNVEHLLMIGGPTDVVVEANILRAAAPARDATPQRPSAAPTDTLPRAVPLGEGNMWPLQPTPEPAPAPRPQRPPVVEEPVQWHAEPEPPPLPPRRAEPRAEHRPEPRAEHRAEPRAEHRPEPRVEHRAEPRVEHRAEPRAEHRPEPRAEPRHEPRPEPRPVDPLAGLAAELSRVQPETPKQRPPAREREIARAPRPERTRPAPAAAEEQFAPNTDQNLAEMAHRLEAALRRPKPAESRASDATPRPGAMAPQTMPEPMPMAASAPMMDTIPQPPEEAPPPPPPPTARAPAPRPAPQRSVYDSLEQEMASLLGRPNNKT